SSVDLLLARLGVVGRRRHGDRGFARRVTMLQGRLHIARHGSGGAANRELLEQKSKLLVVGLRETRLDIVRQVPKAPLEWAERLLPRLVKELLVRVTRLAFVLRVLPEPLVDLPAKRSGKMIEQHVLKVRGEVDLCCLSFRKVVERTIGKRRRAVLHRPGQPGLVARNLGEALEG